MDGLYQEGTEYDLELLKLKQNCFLPRSEFPQKGRRGVLYVDTYSKPNVLYRWDCVEKDYIEIGGGGGDASSWSTFPAIQAVDMDTNNLDNVGNINMDPTSAMVFDNGSRVQEGTHDPGNGGLGGVELECAVGYRAQWDAGCWYLRDTGGFSIISTANQPSAPLVTDDSAKGYIVGSLFALRTQVTYECTDNTIGAAVWSIYAPKADLVGGKVPTAQLPSYVDDVINGYLSVGVFYEEVGLVTPITGETGKIYIDLLTEKTYRWSGAVYVEVSSGRAIYYTVPNVELLQVNWTLSGGFWIYDYANANILSSSIVNVIPSKDDVDIVNEAKILSETDSSIGLVRLYSENQPTADITVTVQIIDSLIGNPDPSGVAFLFLSSANNGDSIGINNVLKGTDDNLYVCFNAHTHAANTVPITGIDYALYWSLFLEKGTNGINGTDGNVWRDGSGVPSNGLGNDDDYYLNSDNGDVYKRAAGTYSIVANINGTDGVDGIDGTNGVGVPAGGTTGQLLSKTSNADHDTQWVNSPRIKRVTSQVSAAEPTINTDICDVHKLTAQAVTITSFTTNLSGTPIDGQGLIIQITGTGPISITWGASFESSTITLPSTTVGTNRLDVGFMWNTATSKWRCIGVA